MRFGKTLTLSMLQYFFDITQNNHSIFEGLGITQEPEYEKYAGKHPVIFVSLKGIKDNTWADAYENYQYVLIELYNTHHYLLTSNTISYAAIPTLFIVKALKAYGNIAPIKNIPIIQGLVTSIF